jgi:hypothetical protein
MLMLLRLHMAEKVAFAAPSQHSKLPGVDTRGAVFAGMIHPDHPFRSLPGRWIAG